MSKTAKKKPARVRPSRAKQATAPELAPVESLAYEQIGAAIDATRARLSALTVRRAELEAAYARGEHYLDAMTEDQQFVADGVRVARLSAHRIVNCEKESSGLSRVLTVRVDGKLYQHTSETPGGHWVYRAV